MDYVFIINPKAGRRDASAGLLPRIQAAGAALGIQPIIEMTTHPGHAQQIAARYAAAGQPVRLYACGGDGTLNEVLQVAVGQPQLALGCVPCGSGNDYVRNFGTETDFSDIAAQLQAQPVSIDVMATSYGYSADICAAGVDAQVAYNIPHYRHLPGCGGSMSYSLAIVETLLHRLDHRLRVTLEGPDGIRVESGAYALLAIGNGQYYGGGYHAAPQACMDDGLLDVVLVRKLTRLQIAGILGDYKKGRHVLPDGTVTEKFRPFLQAFRARCVEIEVLDGRPLIVTLDGECTPCRDRLWVEVRPASLTALLPSCALTAPALLHSALN